MAILGHLLMGFSLVLFFYSFVMSFVGIKNDAAFLTKTSLFSYYAGTLFLGAASCVLLMSLLLDDFTVEYVFLNSSRNTHWVYKTAAFYAGKEGSILFWALTLSLASSSFFIRRFKNRSKAGWELTAVSVVQVFLGAVVFFLNSPFKGMGFIPSDGRGLNPVLENLFMVIHPPFILSGYMLFTIPFACALASLVEKDDSGEWVDSSWRWVLWGFVLLGIGNGLGAYWAYIEFGWGGYWNWDPVENSSLIPWLLSMALIHSLMIEKKLRMNRTWNYALAFAVFVSTMLSAFISRSGIVRSMHSYAGSNVGMYFFFFMIAAALFCGILVFYRCGSIASEKLRSFTSREALFPALNIVLVFFVLAVLTGTFFPFLTGLFWGREITLEPSHYNRLLSLAGPLLLVGIGICPLLRYGRSFEFIAPRVMGYLFFAVLGGLASLFLKPPDPVSVAVFSLSFGALFTVLSGLFDPKGTREKNGRHVFKAFGLAMAHIGIISMGLGIAGSAHKTQVRKSFKTGEKFACSGYEITFLGFETGGDSGKKKVYSVFDLARNGKNISVLKPAKFFHGPALSKMRPRITSKVDTYTGLKHGLVFIVEDFDKDGGRTDLIVIKNPLIFLLWFGAILVFAGALFGIYEKKKNT